MTSEIRQRARIGAVPAGAAKELTARLAGFGDRERAEVLLWLAHDSVTVQRALRRALEVVSGDSLPDDDDAGLSQRLEIVTGECACLMPCGPDADDLVGWWADRLANPHAWCEVPPEPSDPAADITPA